MKIGMGWAALGAAAAVAGATDAAAQTPADLDRLQRQAEHRLAANGPVRPMVPPPAGQPERLRPLQQLWVCANVPEGTAVQTAPQPGAPAMGRTMPYVATTGDYPDGYAKVLHTNGRIGFVPAEKLDAFKLAGDPAKQCRVLGVKPNGTPVFQIR